MHSYLTSIQIEIATTSISFIYVRVVNLQSLVTISMIERINFKLAFSSFCSLYIPFLTWISKTYYCDVVVDGKLGSVVFVRCGIFIVDTLKRKNIEINKYTICTAVALLRTANRTLANSWCYIRMFACQDNKFEFFAQLKKKKNNFNVEYGVWNTFRTYESARDKFHDIRRSNFFF